MPSEPFVPGSHWATDTANRAARAMVANYESPGMRAVLAQFEDGPPPAPPRPAEPPPRLNIRIEDCLLRRGRESDLPRLMELIAAANLPPLFIQEFIEGFCVAEYNGEIIGCGGAEIYGASAVIRSVVVDPRAHGIGLGGRISRLLVEDAKASGARDVYLVTADAHDFWQHLGFADVSLDDWPQPARICWQFWFLHPRRELFAGLYSMWKRV